MVIDHWTWDCFKTKNLDLGLLVGCQIMYFLEGSVKVSKWFLDINWPGPSGVEVYSTTTLTAHGPTKPTWLMYWWRNVGRPPPPRPTRRHDILSSTKKNGTEIGMYKGVLWWIYAVGWMLKKRQVYLNQNSTLIRRRPGLKWPHHSMHCPKATRYVHDNRSNVKF